MMIWTSPSWARNRCESLGRNFARFGLVFITTSSILFCSMLALGAGSDIAKDQEVLKDQLESWYKAGREAEKAGHEQDAVAFFNEILRVDPTHGGAKRALKELSKDGVDLAYKEGALLAAEVRQIVAAGSPVAEAKTSMASGDYAKAQAILREALGGTQLSDAERKEVKKLLDEITALRSKTAERQDALMGEGSGTDIARMIQQVEVLLEAEEVDEAERILRNAAQIDPTNAQVSSLLDRTALLRAGLARRSADLEAASETARKAELDIQARDVFLDGIELYRNNDVIGAVKAWNRVLEIDPQHSQALEMIELTKDLYQAAVDREEASKEAMAQDAEYEEKLNTPIKEYSTSGDLDVNEVLNLLKTLSGLELVKDPSVQGKVYFSIRNRSVREVLDLLKDNYGFAWRREGNRIIVSSKLETRVYPLSDAQYQTLEAVLSDTSIMEDSSQDLRVLLYGPDGKPEAPGKAVYLSENSRSLTVTDTSEKQQSVQAFLSNLPDLKEEYQPIETRIFKLREEEANRIRNIIEHALYGEIGAYDPSSRRKLYLEPESNTLIILDTPENIAKVEAIMQDEEFRRSVQEGDRQARQFIVADSDDNSDDPEALERRTVFLEGISKILRIMLYGAMGEERALQQGRQISINPERGTIDVVDTPENLQKVAQYLSSVRGDTLQDIHIRIFKIEHVPVFDIADALNFLFYDAQQSVRTKFLDIESLQTISGGDTQGVELDPSGLFEESSQDLYNLQSSGGGQDFLQFFSLRLFPDWNSNSLVIYAFEPESIDLVERVISAFDRPHRMLEVEARVISVGLTDLTAIGFDYGITDPLKGDFEFDSGVSDLLALDSNSEPARSFNFQYETLSESQLSFVLNVIDTLETSETLSAPKVLAAPGPNVDILISIGRQDPYTNDVTLDDGGDDDPTNNRLTFDFDTALSGIQLGFIPFILNDNHVYLEILPSISEIIGRVPLTLDDTGGSSTSGTDLSSIQSIGQPIYAQSFVSTALRIRDGETVVIGGLISDSVTESRNDVPLLSKVPFLGAFFSDINYTVSKNSTLIFVTVNIIEPTAY